MRRFAVLALLPILAACGRKPAPPGAEAIVAERKAGALSKRDEILRAIEAAMKWPALKAPEAPPSPAMDVEPVSRNNPQNPGWNTLVLLPPHTETLKTGKSKGMTIPGWYLPECVERSVEASVLGTMENMPLNMKTPDVWKGWFDGLAGLKYTIVVKALSYTPPQLSGDKTFTPGSFGGEARVYRLSDTAYLGGFTFAAKQDSKSVTVYGGKDQSYVEIDFDRSIRAAFAAELRKLFPDTQTEVR